MANEEGNSQVVPWAKFECEHVNRRRSRPFHPRRCKASLISLDSFPDDVVLEILLRLPAQDIHEGAQLVCKKWYKMIRTRDFVYKHLRHSTSTPGLLVHCYRPPVQAVFVAMGRGGIEISKFSFKFKEEVFPGCNGIVLDFDISKRYILRVVNPATKQRFLVPLLALFGLQTCFKHSCIAYAEASKEYKVVHTYISGNYGNPGTRRWAILTVGVDESWREVDSSHLVITPEEHWRRNFFVTEGFVHWPENNTCVLTLNIETEVITPYSMPHGYEQDRRKWFLSTGRSLSVFVDCGRFSFDVWDMKSETGEWTKLYNIDLEAHEPKFGPLYLHDRLVPAGWLKYDEVLVLHVSRPTRDYIAYNVRTQEIDFFDLGFKCLRTFEVHTTSLLPLDGKQRSISS